MLIIHLILCLVTLWTLNMTVSKEICDCKPANLVKTSLGTYFFFYIFHEILKRSTFKTIKVWLCLLMQLNFFILQTSNAIKGTLMQIWKSPCMFLFIYKYYPENFAFLTLRVLELYTRKVCVMFVYKHTETIEYVKK